MWKWIIGIAVAVVAATSGGSDDTGAPKAVPAVEQSQNVVSQQPAGEQAGSQVKAIQEEVKPIEEAKPAAVETVKAADPIETVKPTKKAPATLAGCGEDYYRNVDGVCVHRPSTSPSGASAKCKDGSYSYSQNRRGTCSGHGGVASWL